MTISMTRSKYLAQGGCLDVRRFRAWVDEAKEWGPLLTGEAFEGVQRKHIAFIKDRWEEARTFTVRAQASTSDDWDDPIDPEERDDLVS